MQDVAKNIKRLRSQEGLSQEALAEKLNVTRQTVSSWETGRTQPDLDALTALSAALDAEVTELIYGRRPAGGYVKYQQKYVVTASVLAAYILITVLMWIFWLPPKMAEHNLYYRFSAWMLPFLYGQRPLMYAAFGAFLPCFAAVFTDMGIKNRHVRVLLLCLSAAAAAVAVLVCANILVLPVQNIKMLYLGQSISQTPVLFLPGLGLFLGINK